MSYCRFSSDDFKSDVYCYADCGGGYTTHVAIYRYVFTEELPPLIPFDAEHMEEWLVRHNIVDEMLDRSELVEIGLPYDGKTFNDETPEGAAETLMMLRDAGYNVLQGAIEALLEESVAEE